MSIPNPIRDFEPDASTFAIKWLEENIIDGFRVCSFRFQSTATAAGPVSTYGRIGFPDQANNQPAILHIHGGGQTCSTENILYHLKRGYVCMSFDWTGPVEGRKHEEITHYPDNVDTGIAQTDYQTVFEGGIENNRLVLAAQSARSCLTLLASLPEVDENRIGFYGISWGGFMTWLVNGTDQRAKCAVAIYGTGGLHWPGHLANKSWLKASTEAKNIWTQVLEPRSYATSQYAPIFHINGSNDFFGGIDVASEMMPMIHNRWRCDFTPNCNHHFDQVSANSVCQWFDHYLKGGKPVNQTPDIRAEKTDSSHIRITTKGDPRQTRLYFSSGNATHLNRCWASSNAWETVDDTLTMELECNGDTWLFVRQVDPNSLSAVSSVPICVFVLAEPNATTQELYEPGQFTAGWGHQMGTEIFHADNRLFELSDHGLVINPGNGDFNSILCHGPSDSSRRNLGKYRKLCVEIRNFAAFNVACGIGEPAVKNEWYLVGKEDPEDGALILDLEDFRANDDTPLNSFADVGRLMFSGRTIEGKQGLITAVYWSE